METLLVNSVGKAKRVTRGGREYVVVSMTSVVPGVLNGSKGPLYYPPEETARNVRQWDDTAIVVYHPSDPATGQPLSVNDARVPDEVKIGVLRNSRYVDSLKHDGWFDVQRTEAYDRKLVEQGKPPILPRLLAGEPVELSTGLFTDNVQAPAGYLDHAGNPYSGLIAKNYRRDHLAVLPDQTGACSVKAGCGVNNAGADAGLWDVFVTNAAECVVNAEGVCANCGGPGSGVPGPCPMGGGNATGAKAYGAVRKAYKATKGASPAADAASKAAIEASKDSVVGKKIGHATAIDRHLAAANAHDRAAIDAVPGNLETHHPGHSVAAAHFETARAHRDAAAAHRLQLAATHNAGEPMTCTMNAESVCVNCGGKGGTKGPCPGGGKAKPPAHPTKLATQDAYAASRDSVKGQKTGHATAIDRHTLAARMHDDHGLAASKAGDHESARKHFGKAALHRKKTTFHAKQLTRNYATEGTSVTKTETIAALIANGAFKAADKPHLEAFDEATLNVFVEKFKPAAPDPVANCGPKTFDELVRTDPKASATWNTAQKIEARERGRLIGILTANTADATLKAKATARYEAMDTDALADLVEAQPPITNADDARATYTSPAAIYAPSPTPSRTPTANRYDGTKAPLRPYQPEPASDSPVANWKKQHA